MCRPAPARLWKSFRRSRTRFRGRPETVRPHRGIGVRLRPGILFGIIPECRSELSRNRVHLAPDSPLKPEYDVGGRLLGWDLILQTATRPSRNLLEPRGNWRGLQPWMLRANDLAAGPDKSAFGRERTFRPADRMLIAIRIEDAGVATPAVGVFVIDMLRVTVTAVETALR